MLRQIADALHQSEQQRQAAVASAAASWKDWRFITVYDLLERAENGGANDPALCAQLTPEEARRRRTNVLRGSSPWSLGERWTRYLAQAREKVRLPDTGNLADGADSLASSMEMCSQSGIRWAGHSRGARLRQDLDRHQRHRGAAAA